MIPLAVVVLTLLILTVRALSARPRLHVRSRPLGRRSI